MNNIPDDVLEEIILNKVKLFTKNRTIVILEVFYWNYIKIYVLLKKRNL